MHPRAQFKRGLAWIGLGVLVLGGSTWCTRGGMVTYSFSNPIDEVVSRLFARLDLEALAGTAVITVLFLVGLFRCVDALVWNRNQARDEGEPGDRATSTDKTH